MLETAGDNISLFNIAIRHGHVEVFKKLLPRINLREHSYTYFAASWGRWEILKELQKAGIKFSDITMFAAATNGHIEVVKNLLKEGTPIDNGTVYPVICQGHLEVLKVLVEVGAEVNYKAARAAAEYDKEILEYLREKGLNHDF